MKQVKKTEMKRSEKRKMAAKKKWLEKMAGKRKRNKKK